MRSFIGNLKPRKRNAFKARIRGSIVVKSQGLSVRSKIESVIIFFFFSLSSALLSATLRAFVVIAEKINPSAAGKSAFLPGLNCKWLFRGGFRTKNPLFYGHATLLLSKKTSPQQNPEFAAVFLLPLCMSSSKPGVGKFQPGG